MRANSAQTKQNPSNDVKIFALQSSLKMSHFNVQVTCFVSQVWELHGAENSYSGKLILVVSRKKNRCWSEATSNSNWLFPNNFLYFIVYITKIVVKRLYQAKDTGCRNFPANVSEKQHLYSFNKSSTGFRGDSLP